MVLALVLDNLLTTAGFAFFTVGVFLLCVPAGWMVMGVLTLVLDHQIRPESGPPGRR